MVQPARTHIPHSLNEDLDQGFYEAVNRSQVRLALQYLNFILERDRKVIEELRAEVEELKSAKPSVAKKTATAEKTG